MVRKVLPVCGVLSSLLYVAMNVIAAMLYEGYHSASQTVNRRFPALGRGAGRRPLTRPSGTAPRRIGGRRDNGEPGLSARRVAIASPQRLVPLSTKLAAAAIRSGVS